VDAVTGRVLGAALVFGAIGLFAKSVLRPNTIAGGAVPMPETVLRYALATLLLLSGVKLAAPPGASVGIAFSVGIGLVALFTYGLVSRRTSAKPLPAAGTTTPITLRPDA